MTREQKLALVLGFAAVLVVGLLISDHLAAARSTDLEDAPHDATVVVDAEEGQALRRVVTLPQNEEHFRGRPITRMAARERGTTEQPSEPQREETLVASVPERETVETTPPAPIEFVLGANGGEQTGGSESMIGRMGDAVADGAQGLAERLRQLTTRVGDSRIESMAVVDNQQGEPVSRRVSTSPTIIQHHVQANESLYKIAAKYYGDGNEWRRIARDNEGRVGENGSVRQGVTLRIFDPKVGVAPDQAVASAPVKPDVDPIAKPQTRTVEPKGPLTYTVKSGDTLGEISMELLGTIRRQHELIALNRDVLKDPDQLRAGMVLKLPSS